MTVFTPTKVRHADADSETVAEFLSRTGYDIETAVADIIDNSIDASASRLVVSLILDDHKPAMIAVADDGRGMTAPELERAASLAKDPRKQDGQHLGRYGAGLKAASFSLGRMLYIATRTAGGKPRGAILDREVYKREYEYRDMDPGDAAAIIGADWGGRPLGKSGTVILIGDLVSMVPTSDESSDLLSKRFNVELDTRLGLVYHRMIGSRRITINKSRRHLSAGGFQKEFAILEIAAVNPFGYSKSGQRGYPKKLVVSTGPSKVTVRLHVWPKQGRTKDERHPFYAILGRSTDWQGLYFYRWDRLLQAGGWNGLRSLEPHSSYARVEVDLPLGSDDEFRPTVQKDKIENARPLLEALMKRPEWSGYIAAASAVARGRTAVVAKKRTADARANANRKRRVRFATFAARPSLRISEGQLELDRKLVTRLGRDRASALADIVWQAVLPHVGKKRMSPAVKAQLEAVEAAVARLAGTST
jgi:hypothetical protein